MKRFAIALVAFVATIGSATAQNDDRWEAQGNLFSLDFRAWGWTELSPSSENELLGIEHLGFQQGGLMRTCFVTERRFPSRPGVSQATLNALAARSDGRLDTGMPRSLTPVTVDGVTVIDAIYDRPIYMHMRWFYILGEASVRQIHINCGASDPASSEVEANISSMLQTLRIGAGS